MLIASSFLDFSARLAPNIRKYAFQFSARLTPSIHMCIYSLLIKET